MCMASVRDCRALAEAHPVDVTSARIPCVISSHAAERKTEREREISRTEYAGAPQSTLKTLLTDFLILARVN